MNSSGSINLASECNSLNLSIEASSCDIGNAALKTIREMRQNLNVPPIWNTNQLKEYKNNIVRKTLKPEETLKSFSSNLLLSNQRKVDNEIQQFIKDTSPERRQQPIVRETKTVALRKNRSSTLLQNDTKSVSNILTTRSKRILTPKSSYIPVLRFAAINRKEACFSVENPGILYETTPQQTTLFPRRYFNTGSLLSDGDDDGSHTSINLATAKTIETINLENDNASPWKDVLKHNPVMKKKKRPAKKKVTTAFTQTVNVEKIETGVSPFTPSPPEREVITARNGQIMCQRIANRQNEIHRKCIIQSFPSLSILPERKIQKVVSISIAPDAEKKIENDERKDNIRYLECSYVPADPICNSMPADGTSADNSIPKTETTLKNFRESSSEEIQILNSQRKRPSRYRVNRRRLRAKKHLQISSDDDMEIILKNTFALSRKPEKSFPFVKNANNQTEELVKTLSNNHCMVDKATNFNANEHNLSLKESLKTKKNSEEDSDDDFIVKIFEKIKNDSSVAIAKTKEISKKKEKKQSPIANRDKTFLVADKSCNTDEANKSPKTHDSDISKVSKNNSEQFSDIHCLESEIEKPSMNYSDDFEDTDYSFLLEENPEFSKTINRIKSNARKRDYDVKKPENNESKQQLLLNDDKIQRAVKLFLESLYTEKTAQEIEKDQTQAKSDIFLPELLCAGWSDDCSILSRSCDSNYTFSDSSSDTCVKGKLRKQRKKFYKNVRQKSRNRSSSVLNIPISNGNNSSTTTTTTMNTENLSLSEGEVRSLGEI